MPRRSSPSGANNKSASSRAAKGEKLRRRVLGDAHVDRSLAEVDILSQDMTPLLHEWVWDDIWGRPGLPLKTRSMLSMALLAALNRPRELRIHLKGALNNGCTVEEIREVLMHVALYAGVPATLDGLHTAREFLREAGMLPVPKTKKK